MCKVKDALLDFEGTDMSDRDLLGMELREISNLLSCRYDENVGVGVPEARLVLDGMSPTTGKRMELVVILREKEVF